MEARSASPAFIAAQIRTKCSGVTIAFAGQALRTTVDLLPVVIRFCLIPAFPAEAVSSCTAGLPLPGVTRPWKAAWARLQGPVWFDSC